MITETTTTAAADQLTVRFAQWERVQAMSDDALDEAVHERVWGALPPQSEEDLLLSELLTRFENLAGIVREESGCIVERDAEHNEAQESLVYVREAVHVADENGDAMVSLRTERVRDVLVAAGERSCPLPSLKQFAVTGAIGV